MKKTTHSAKTGKFVSKEFAKENPETTVEVRNKERTRPITDKTKVFIDLSKLSEEQQKHIILLLPEPRTPYLLEIEDDCYTLVYVYTTSDGWQWLVGLADYMKGRTELTYPEFIKLFEGGESESNIPNPKNKTMKNTQLRRGNKVLHNGVEKTIDCISPECVNFIEDKPNTESFGSWVDLDEVDFIPLSENHLFSRGFEKGGFESKYFIKPNSGFFLGISLNGTLYFMFNEDNIMPVKCKFYHQLQNIFFALTGVELETELNSNQ